MTPQELRIGNFVKSIEDDKSYEVVAIDHLGNGYYNGSKSFGKREKHINEHAFFFKSCELLGIPLASEWLLKLGFEYLPNRNFMSIGTSPKFQNYFSIDLRGNYVEFSYKRITVEYVHQLQNLYFALTEKELRIN